jgi:thermostable 8-oxoguanine DNA glycosylase
LISSKRWADAENKMEELKERFPDDKTDYHAVSKMFVAAKIKDISDNEHKEKRETLLDDLLDQAGKSLSRMEATVRQGGIK